MDKNKLNNICNFIYSIYKISSSHFVKKAKMILKSKWIDPKIVNINYNEQLFNNMTFRKNIRAKLAWFGESYYNHIRDIVIDNYLLSNDFLLSNNFRRTGCFEFFIEHYINPIINEIINQQIDYVIECKKNNKLVI